MITVLQATAPAAAAPVATAARLLLPWIPLSCGCSWGCYSRRCCFRGGFLGCYSLGCYSCGCFYSGCHMASAAMASSLLLLFPCCCSHGCCSKWCCMLQMMLHAPLAGALEAASPLAAASVSDTPVAAAPSHCKDTVPKIGEKYFQKGNCAASFPISTFIYLWAVCLLSSSKIGGPILGIYKSLTDVWIIAAQFDF